MTDLLPTIPTRDELVVLTDLARTLHGTGMFPRALDTPGKLMAVLLRGRELNLGPMAALAGIHVVEGKAALSAEMMLAIVRRAGHRVDFIETTDRRCTVKGHRGDQVLESTYTWEDAARFRKKEGDRWMPATETFNYRGHPAAMLRARAVSALCRMLYSDVTLGLVTPDEAEEIAAHEAQDVEVREAKVRDVTPVQPQLSEAAAMLAPLIAPPVRPGRTDSPLPPEAIYTCTDAEEARPITVKAEPILVGSSPDVTVTTATIAVTVTPKMPADVAPAPYAVPTTLEQQAMEKPSVPKETLGQSSAELRAAIRQLVAELGPGSLVEAKKAIGLAAAATPTDAERKMILAWLEDQSEIAMRDRLEQEREEDAMDNRANEEEVMA